MRRLQMRNRVQEEQLGHTRHQHKLWDNLTGALYST